MLVPVISPSFGGLFHAPKVDLDKLLAILPPAAQEAAQGSATPKAAPATKTPEPIGVDGIFTFIIEELLASTFKVEKLSTENCFSTWQRFAGLSPADGWIIIATDHTVR